jgi:hypothetical protein
VTFAVIPFVDPRGNSFCDARGEQSMPIDANKELCELLRNWVQEGKVEIALHGVTHRDDNGPEFAQNNAPAIDHAINYLSSVFDTKITTFVPPHNIFSRQGYMTVRNAGMNILGSVPFNLATRPLCDISILSFLHRRIFLFKAGHAARYPFPIDVHRHVELSCFGFLREHGFDHLKQSMDFVDRHGGYLAVATHWWELRDHKHLRIALRAFLDQNLSRIRSVKACEVWKEHALQH